MHCTTTFHLYLISFHIETNISCFKEVNVSNFFANCISMKEIRKTIRKMVLESFSEHITGICSTFCT